MLDLHPCGLCLGWVAECGESCIEHDCPLVAAWMVIRLELERLVRS